jgi:hypothetical protein
MTAIDNPKIGSSTAVATTAMITPTDRGTRRTPIRPFRCRAHRDTVPVALRPGLVRRYPKLAGIALQPFEQRHKFLRQLSLTLGATEIAPVVCAGGIPMPARP